MKFESLKPGMLVYDVQKRKMGNTQLTTVSVFNVRIISVNYEAKTFMYSWNNNAPRKGTEHTAKRYKKSEPVLIRSPMGYNRKATREEIKAMKND